MLRRRYQFKMYRIKSISSLCSGPDLIRRVLVMELEQSQGALDSDQFLEHELGPIGRLANLKRWFKVELGEPPT